MRYSLKFKLTAILIAIVSAVIFITWFLNVAFAEQFYELSEKKNIIQTYRKIDALLYKYSGSGKSEDTEDEEADAGEDESEDRLYQDEDSGDRSAKGEAPEEIVDDEIEEDIENEIIDICNRANIRMMVTDPDAFLFGQSVVCTNIRENSGGYKELLWLLSQLQTRYIFSSQFNKGFTGKFLDDYSLLNVDDDAWSKLMDNGYIVRIIKNVQKGSSGIYLFGFTKSEHFVAMVVPLDSIETSAAISSRFFLYVGIIGIVLGCVAILIVSTRFTRPIKEMARVADRMAQLDFDAKVEVSTKDELEDLGNSMNTLSETLESTIADLKAANIELQKDIEKKEQIDEMRKEFLSHVSHELKTPIALIQGYAEGLSENIMDDEESKEFYCEVIADEARKMNIMVQKLLTLNQIEFGNTQLDLQRFDICQLIRNKIQSSQILIMKNQNRVEFDAREPVYVWADEFMIEEVFSNYFSNALHHVIPGGLIRVWMEPRDGDIRIHVFNEGNQIPEEDIEKLWIKFYKVDKARTREYGGSGIGLSIVAATMNAHGKKFGVSNVENGVDFWFDLDAEASAEGESDATC